MGRRAEIVLLEAKAGLYICFQPKPIDDLNLEVLDICECNFWAD